VKRPFWFLVFLIALSVLRPGVFAQDLARQPTAFTAWVDFHKPTAAELPIWIERVDKTTVQPDPALPEKTVYRLRFRRFPGLVDEVLLRVYFDDTAGAQPVLSAWNEIGARVLDQTLGQGLGLPSSETVRLPMSGIDYVDIQAAGRGAGVRGVLALALHKTETREGMDFGGAASVTDPFGNATPAVAGTNDVILFGRVKATLEPGVLSLGAGDNPAQGAAFDFPLVRPPLIALLTFEILNANISAPPELSVNGKDAGPVSLAVTDLADPALTGSVEAARPDAVYRYGGWLKCQKVIPGSLLTTGSNELLISTPGNPDPVALRSIEVQLKYTSDVTSP